MKKIFLLLFVVACSVTIALPTMTADAFLNKIINKTVKQDKNTRESTNTSSRSRQTSENAKNTTPEIHFDDPKNPYNPNGTVLKGRVLLKTPNGVRPGAGVNITLAGNGLRLDYYMNAYWFVGRMYYQTVTDENGYYSVSLTRGDDPASVAVWLADYHPQIVSAGVVYNERDGIKTVTLEPQEDPFYFTEKLVM